MRLAEHLRTAIITGELNVGDPLPKERELVTDQVVSRSTVREAIRMLHAQGLVEVRRGRNGGAFVSRPQSALLSQSLNLFIDGEAIKLRDLVKARSALEVAAAGQAAEERTDAQLAMLRERSIACSDALNDLPTFVQANLAWHVAVIEASNNPLFITFMQAITTAIGRVTDSDKFDLVIRKLVTGANWSIFLAIEGRDAEAASRRMARHLAASSRALEEIAASRQSEAHK